MNATPFSRRILLTLPALAALGAAPEAGAREAVIVSPDDGPLGRPRVVLDRLIVPQATPERARIAKVLERTLRREARRVEWGAGTGSRISYRFYLEELEVVVQSGVLKVRCTAFGQLPRGKNARSRLEYGGDPKAPRQVIDRVLEIVARGVLSRLAEQERERRARR